MITCYMCGQECELYRKALRDSKDDIDRYLVVNSCKRGCPNWYDRDNACYEPTEDSEWQCMAMNR